jgi:pyruvate dehydrogenase E1 component alpha subunit
MAPDAHPLSGARLLTTYQQMLLMRRFEERTGMLYQMRKFSGFCHLYIGQEAVAAGVSACLRTSDYMISGYREHAQAIAKGVDGAAVMAELFGRETGCSGGKGGSMHIYDPACRFMGGWGIVGAQIANAVGFAFTAKYRGTDDVCVCFFGEGAIHQGAFHEAMNMAALWKLPVVYICENNYYAMGTPLHRQTNVTEVHIKARGYDTPSALVDGQDLRAVYDQTAIAVERARRGEGPTLLEMKTYRFRGHSMSDPANYRTREEVEEEKKRDPLLTVARWLVEEGVATDEQLTDLDEKVKAEVLEMVAFAEASEPPPVDSLWDNVVV